MRWFTLKILFLVCVFCHDSFAITFEIVGPCAETPIKMGKFQGSLDESVGKTTIDLLDFYQIDYVGTEIGINSIMNSPTGDEALEILSDTKLRAYGWCFSINGEIPDKLASDVFFTSSKDHLRWFYAYSTYDSGKWVDYCMPSYKIKSQQICKLTHGP